MSTNTKIFTMGIVSIVRSVRSLVRRCNYYWLGPTTVHLRLEACLLISLSTLTLGYMNNLHEGVNLQDLQILSIFTLFLSRHLLFRLFLSWDPVTSRSPTNFITVFLQSHVIQGTSWDRTCRDIPSQVYEWTDMIPSSILYLYQVAQVYILSPLSLLSGKSHSGSHDEVKKPMDGSSRWFFWHQRVYIIWFEHIAPRVSLHWFLWIIFTVDSLSLFMRVYADFQPSRDLDRLVILTGTALHRLDDTVPHAKNNNQTISLFRKYYMAAIVTSVFSTGRLLNAPPDFYKVPSLWGSVLYVVGRWIELLMMLDMLPVQSCRGTGFCSHHCALAPIGYADFHRKDCDNPDIFFAWTFLMVSATILLVGTLLAQCVAHSYTIWKDSAIRGREEWKIVESPLSIVGWKDTVKWESFFMEKTRYNKGDRYFQWWGRRTYEAINPTSRPPPSFQIEGFDATSHKLAWLVPLAQLQWLVAAIYLIMWLVRFFFFGIYSAWVYGLYAMVAHGVASYAVTYPAPRIRQHAQEVNDRAKKYRW
jgi:hypothetical protein